MNDAIFSQIDFGPLKEYIDDDNVTEISYSNNGQIFLNTLDKGIYRIEREDINNTLMEKLALQCSSVMGKTFNMAHPYLDSESSELHLSFIHDSISSNGICCTIKKTSSKIRLNKDKLIEENYITEELLDFLFACVSGHCNIIVSGENGTGRTELVKYLASHTKDSEKIITIENSLELQLDKIFPQRNIIAIKKNDMTDYKDILNASLMQRPRYIILSEITNSDEASSLRDIVSKGYNVMSTIHADSAKNVPLFMSYLLESSEDVNQFLKVIHRYIHLAIHLKASTNENKYQREIAEVCEFYVDDNNNVGYNVIYKKDVDGTVHLNNPTKYLKEYLNAQDIIVKNDLFLKKDSEDNKIDVL